MFAVPDLTIPELASSSRRLPPATLIRAVAADSAAWLHLISYDPDVPSRVHLYSEHDDMELWLRGWLPGQTAPLGPPEAMFAVVVGEIAELDASGWRVLQAGQTRVLGRGNYKQLANRSAVPAVTLHAAVDITRHATVGLMR